MEQIKTHSIDLFRFMKKSPISTVDAFANIIDYQILHNTSVPSNKLAILVNVNLRDKWVQFIDNGCGLEDREKILNVWNDIDFSKYKSDFKISSLILGQDITFESKNMNFAFMTTLDTTRDINFAKLQFVKGEEILRSFKSGSRISIANLNKSLSIKEMENIAIKIKDKFQYKINDGVKIYFNLIDDKNYNFIDTKFVAVDSFSKSLFLTNKLDDELERHFDNVEILSTVCPIMLKVYEANNCGKINLIHHMKKFELSNEIFLPEKLIYFLKNRRVDIFVDCFKLSYFGADFEVSKNDYEILISWLIEKLEIADIIFKKDDEKIIQETHHEIISEYHDILNNITTQLEEEKELETIKLYLTKAFDISENKVDEFEIIKDKLRFTYHADDGKEITMNLIRSKDKDFGSEWMNLMIIKEDVINQVYEYDLKLNHKHPYFIEFFQDKEFTNKMEHFIICYAISETVCRLDGTNVTQLKYEINKLLRRNNN
ncbi:MAG: hypothetical protein ACRC42_03645 [Mycoplasma sp.]